MTSSLPLCTVYQYITHIVSTDARLSRGCTTRLPCLQLPCLHYLACKVSHPVNEASRFIQHLSILTFIWCCYLHFPRSRCRLSVVPPVSLHAESYWTRDFIIYCHNYIGRSTTLRATLYELAIGLEGASHTPRDHSSGDILQKNASKVHADRSRRFSSQSDAYELFGPLVARDREVAPPTTG